MKKLIALSLALSMSAAFAADDVVYGTFVLNSSEPELILGVPWVNPGNAGAINVTDLIQTTTLEDDDQLFYYVGGVYKAWEVTTTEDGKKVWTAATIVSDNIIKPTGDEALSRGNAIILKRVKKDDRSYNIIINGQFTSESAGAITMAKGTKDKPAYSLVAPSSVTPKKLNEGNWQNVGAGDMIVIGLPNGKMGFYYYGTDTDTGKGCWGTRTLNSKWEYEFTNADASIPAGQGVWFVSDGSELSAVSCEWN